MPPKERARKLIKLADSPEKEKSKNMKREKTIFCFFFNLQKMAHGLRETEDW